MWQSIESGPAAARDMHVVVKIERMHKNIHYNLLDELQHSTGYLVIHILSIVVLCINIEAFLLSVLWLASLSFALFYWYYLAEVTPYTYICN